MHDPEWDAELAPFAERLRMALAEAGYPDAHVYVGPSGVFVDGVPDDVQLRAFEVCDRV